MTLPTSVPARVLAVAMAMVAALGVTAGPGLAARPDHKPAPATVEVQLLAINDFHGNLEATDGLRLDPATGSSRGDHALPAGGAEYLASHVRALEVTNPNTAVVSAGDLIGASPLLSALFHDEPTIEAMNRIGRARRSPSSA